MDQPEYLKGLDVLGGFKNLSYDEQQNFIQKNIQAGKLTQYSPMEDIEKLYRNGQYIAKYGIESFKNTPNKADRDLKFKEDIVSEAMLSKYGSDPMFEEYRKMSLDGQIELLESDHKNTADLEAERNKKQRIVEDLQELKKRPFIDREDLDIMEDHPQNEYEEKIKINTGKYDKIKANDNDRIIKASQPIISTFIDRITEDYNNGVLTDEDLDTQFQEATKYSRYYNAFKDAKELEDLTIEDKIRFIATQEAIKGTLGDEEALDITEQQVQNYVSDNQSGLDWTWGTTKNIAVGGIAHIANTGLGAYSLLAAMHDSVTGENTLGLFLEGKDSEGNTLPYYLNPQYWNGVDMFNTLSEGEIKKAQLNGGISPYQNITRAGEEMDFFSWNTLNESAKMAKYIWSTALMNYVGGVLTKGISKNIFGAKYTTSAWNPRGLLLEAESSGIGTKVNKALNLGTHITAAMPMAMTMGTNSYNETKQSLTEIIDKKIKGDVDNILSNLPEEEVNNIVNEYVASEEIQTLINESIQMTIDEYAKEGITIPEKDLKKLREEYNNHYKIEILKDPKGLIYEYLGDSVTEQVSSKYEKDRELAEKAAVAAFKTQATVTQFKEMFTNALLRNYLFSKSQRVIQSNDFIDDIVTDPKTGLLRRESEGLFRRYVKPWGKQIVGEFGDEWFDAHSEHLAQGFGLGVFNNITGAKYNPEKYIYANNLLGNFLAGAEEGFKNVKDMFFDKAGIYEGLIGAISPFTSITPSLSMFSKKPANYKELSFAEKLSRYITNPLISEVAEANEQRREADFLMEQTNKVLKQNKEALQDITTLISTLNSQEESNLKHDLLESQDSEMKKAFELMYILKRAQSDPVYRRSSVMLNALETIDKISNGEIDDATITSFLGQPNNKDISKQSDSKEQAVERLQKNASQLAKMQKDIIETEEALSKSEVGRSLNEVTKKQVIFNKLYDSNISERLSSLEKNINNRDSVSEDSNIYAEYNTTRGYNATLKQAQDEVTAINEKIDKLEKRTKQLNDLKKKKELTKEQSIELYANTFALQEYKNNLKESKKRLKEIQKNPVSDEDQKVLSKEEILALNPEQRAKMLNTKNKELYSVEQRAIINELIQDLTRTDPDLIRQVSDSGELFRRRRLNREAYTKILNNQEVFTNYASIMEEAMKSRAEIIANNMVRERVFADLDSVDDFEVYNKVVSNNYGHRVLTDYMNSKPERKPLMGPIIELVKLKEDANTIINNTYKDPNERLTFKNIVINTIYNAKTVEQAMSALESMIDSTEEDALKQKLENLLTELENKRYQRNASIKNARKTTTPPPPPLSNDDVEKDTEKTDAEIPKDLDLSKGEEVDLDSDAQGEDDDIPQTTSPTLEEQLQNADTDTSIHQISQDIDDEGNDISDMTISSYIGNKYPGYEVTPMNDLGYAVPKTGAVETDIMTAVYNFLNSKGIKLQDIIDFELAKILKKNPDTKVHFMMYKENKTVFNKTVFNVIKYTEDVKKIHDESRGGVITANGEQWLIIGTAGTEKSDVEGKVWFKLLDRIKDKKIKYFNNSSTQSELYYVSDEYTQVKEIQTGRRVRKLEGDEKVELRKISSLLYDGNEYNKQRNPFRLGNPKNKKQGYADLKWFIQRLYDYLPVNVGSNKVIPLTSPSDRLGNTFLLVPSASGVLLPIYIQPAFYNKMEDCALKTRIDNCLLKLVSKKVEDRKKAKDELRQLLVFTDETNIELGNDKYNTISIVRNGTRYKTYTLDSTFSFNEFLKDFIDTDFRINITESVLRDPVLTAEYDDAGALLVDVASLCTRNASYTMYLVGDDGKPSIDDEVKTPAVSQESPEKKRFFTHTIVYKGKNYRVDASETYYTDDDEVITSINPDGTTNEENKQLLINLILINRIYDKTPDYKEVGFNYYVLNPSENNPRVVKQGEHDELSLLKDNDAKEIIEKIKKKKEAEEKAKAAKEEFEKILDTAPLVDIDDFSDSEVITYEEDIVLNDVGVNNAVQNNVEQSNASKQTETKQDSKTNTNDSFDNLRDSSKITTFANIFKKTKFRTKLKQIFASKGWEFSNNTEEVEKFLNNKKIPTTNITDIDTWMEIIENCRS